MPDANIGPVNLADNETYRYTRENFMSAGLDNFTTPPAENPDMYEVLQNVHSPLTNSFKRRYGYRAFQPKLDQGTPNGDVVAQTILFGAGFNGSTGYVDTNNSLTLASNAPLSIEFWFLSFSSSGGSFVSLNTDKDPSGGSTDVEVKMNSSGNIVFTYTNSASATTTLTTPAAYNDGNPHHCVVTVTAGGVANIYVDGSSVVNSTTHGVQAFSGVFWRLSDSDGSGFLATFLSHVSVWPVALSSTQVTNHYNALIALNGSQLNYESIVKADSPSYFWYLTETTNAAQPPQTPTVQSQTSIFTTSSGTVTFGLNTTLGNSILVIVAEDKTGNTGSVPTVNDNLSNSYSAITNSSKLYSFIAPVVNPGATTITISGMGSVPQTLVIAQEIRGVITSGPVDGKNADSVSFPVSSHSTPSISTASAPDRVYSVVFTFTANSSGSAQASIASGSPYFIASSLSASPPFGGQSFVGVAYTSAATVGTYSGSWTTPSAVNWQTQTFGLVLNSSGAATGTIAYDHAGTNNGTYQTVTPSPKNNTLGGSSTFFTSGSGSGPWTSNNITPTSQINTGDTIFVALQLDPLVGGGVTVGVASLVDNQGNTYSATTPFQTYTSVGGDKVTVQLWSAGASATIPVTSSIQFTINLSRSVANDTFSEGCQMFTIPGLGNVDQQNHASGTTGTSWSSGGITVSQTEFAISLAGDTVTTTTPTGFTNFSLNSGADSLSEAYIVATGSIIDTWTTGVNANWTVSLTSWMLSLGYALGESIVV